MYSRSSEVSSGEKTSAKLEYSVGIKMEALFTINAAICVLQEGWTLSSGLLLRFSRKAMCTTKFLCPGSKAVATNSFFPISSTCLVVGRAFSIV